ncbi:molybdopterin biosynthesis protein [Oceaniovalibus guishaninsula JLT2003]|uniref:Molybdopterin-synthase adenylyltransferase n=1 Tax=Oceaniovalibus guishaninsula JLT2003 TaxID=1231392 RepID=K2HLV3_9RHOB|nr:HesA/MoeB/ThiF family protein [Oceaniovalibus guishaninsula]EKE43874.1 molybdopterin biosynthesis protein [Oceaniovalibus guishaninsula JLT2003]
MLLALLLAAAIWFGGRRIGWPVQARLTMLALLYVAILAVNVGLPPGNPLRQATGGSAGEWLVLGGVAALVLLYRAGLGRLRGHVRPENRKPELAPGQFAPGEVQRYARHIALREIGGPGQKRLKAAKVLVVGAGGLGSPALLYLTGAGIGTLGVIDDDTVEQTNLQRQIIHTDARTGMPKVFSAELAIRALNPNVAVRPYRRKLTADMATALVEDYDLVLDGTDDIGTRYVVNAACIAARVPLISGALSQWEGQVTIFAPWDGTPCYRCIFPDRPAPGLAPSCAEAGVLGPLPGIVGTIMAAEAIKELTGAGETLRGRMAIHDALWGENRTILLTPRPDCPDCGHLRRGAAAR